MPGRNDPCACGSGKKYKKCCLGRSGQTAPGGGLSPRFRFEPGSYGAPGGFVSSIACLKQVRPDEWEYHFVLVCPEHFSTEEYAAVSQATEDLDLAFADRLQTGDDFSVARHLKDAGYVSVRDFMIAGAEP